MSVKNNFAAVALLCLLLIGSTAVHAQEDSVSVTSEVVEGSEIRNYCYFSAEDYEQKTLFKLGSDNFNIHWGLPRFPGLHLSWEQKLSTTISSELGAITPAFYEYTVFLNFRYYYNKGKKRRLKSGDVLNNFNGNYFLLGVYRTMRTNNSPEIYYSNSLMPKDRNTYNLFYGKQQKVGKWGYVDVAGGLSYAHWNKQLQFSMNFKVGLGYGKFSGPDDLQSLKYSEFKDEYNNTKGLLKLANPYMLIGGGWRMGGTVAYERKLTSNFSIIPALHLSAHDVEHESRLSGTEVKYRHTGKRMHLDLQARYYYNRDKKLRSGCPVKNFTGHYLFAEGEGLLSFYDIKFDGGVESGFNAIKPSLHLGWGTQQRIGKRVFFDVGVGLRYINQEYPVNVGVNAQIGLLLGK